MACINAPIWVSMPYFLYGPQWLQKRVKLPRKPNKDLHEIVAYIEPTTGMSLAIRNRIQVYNYNEVNAVGYHNMQHWKMLSNCS
jgi:hypothetical protein